MKLADRGPGMSMIVKTVTRWLKGPILLFGIYIVLYGHITPGGGFGGGVIIASAFLLVMLAMGEEDGLRHFSKAAASRLDSIGLLIFLALGWLGTWYGSYFFQNFIETPEQAYFTLFSGGTMLAMNMALGLKVASALFLVFTILTAFHITSDGATVGAAHGRDYQKPEKESRAWPAPTNSPDPSESPDEEKGGDA